ncbi:GcrA family cell cycle regulator [Aquamicrobium zhengzhouense]|uniref:GcrA cell cycle regulator n=1 Tax=Aquamicrobium zhengzhouense TaxID=2781738 RepID=A0ABS0SA31_9HYPH|nr:GcrA family cell cycle regulator [Aquamicrobium zhengzhouense]MBI1620134.1 hypothetical protein [Aquamicrobium zhengzhouense]
MSASVITTPAPWSDDEIALAARLWGKDGRSATEIAAVLSRRFGTNRRDVHVLRLANRLRNLFPPRGEGHRSLSRVFDRLGKASDYVERPSKGEAAAYDAASRKLTLVQLGSCQCRFPVESSGTTHLFCGARTEPLRPYCQHHEIRASARGLMQGAIQASQEEGV